MGTDGSIIRYALLGGIITGATIGLPVLDLLNCACCAGVMLGGFLAVFFATRDEEQGGVVIAKSDALRLGVLSGLFGAVIGTVLHALVLALAGDVMLDLIRSFLSDAEVQGSLPPVLTEGLDELYRSQGGFSLFDVVVHLLIWLVIAPLFGLLGGLIGFSVFGDNRKPPLTPTTEGMVHP